MSALDDLKKALASLPKPPTAVMAPGSGVTADSLSRAAGMKVNFVESDLVEPGTAYIIGPNMIDFGPIKWNFSEPRWFPPDPVPFNPRDAIKITGIVT